MCVIIGQHAEINHANTAQLWDCGTWNDEHLGRFLDPIHVYKPGTPGDQDKEIRTLQDTDQEMRLHKVYSVP
jgi:hypothetical protein